MGEAVASGALERVAGCEPNFTSPNSCLEIRDDSGKFIVPRRRGCFVDLICNNYL